jgi:hypothetical protein
MEPSDYTLNEILASISTYKKPKAKKRLIFDQAPLGGIGSKWLISFFFLLPLIEYAGIFNPFIFGMLGIAQAIIFYVIFFSMIMILIFALSFINNTKVIRQITPSWQNYFPTIDIDLILSSGASPYKDFFKHYSVALNKGLKNDALYQYLKEAFILMQEENKDLLEAMAKKRER